MQSIIKNMSQTKSAYQLLIPMNDNKLSLTINSNLQISKSKLTFYISILYINFDPIHSEKNMIDKKLKELQQELIYKDTFY